MCPRPKHLRMFPKKGHVKAWFAHALCGPLDFQQIVVRCSYGDAFFRHPPTCWSKSSIKEDQPFQGPPKRGINEDEPFQESSTFKASQHASRIFEATLSGGLQESKGETEAHEYHRLPLATAERYNTHTIPSETGGLSCFGASPAPQTPSYIPAISAAPCLRLQ